MAKFIFKKRYSFKTIAIKTSEAEAKKVFNQIDSGNKNINKHRRITKFNKKLVVVSWNDFGKPYNVYIYRDKRNRTYVVDNPGSFYLFMVRLYMFVLGIFVR